MGWGPPNMFRCFIGNAAELGVYDHAKHFYPRVMTCLRAQSTLQPARLLALSVIVVTEQPNDVVKTRCSSVQAIPQSIRDRFTAPRPWRGERAHSPFAPQWALYLFFCAKFHGRQSSSSRMSVFGRFLIMDCNDYRMFYSHVLLFFFLFFLLFKPIASSNRAIPEKDNLNHQR